jgi:acetyltransferase-like isoleucine patch superfamily enzyme
MNLGAFAGKIRDLPATVGLPWDYFARRGIFLDCRGPLTISATSRWGYMVQVFTESHDLSQWPALGPVIPYGVTVDEQAWIGSQALLSGCHIGIGAVVAAGTVVRGQDVAPLVMVAGNPARVIARWQDGDWHYLPVVKSGYARRLE